MNKQITINLKTLKAVLPFASDDPTRYCLNGVLIDKENIVATDGRRAICVAHGQKLNDENLRLIIPLAACKLILKAADKKAKDFSLSTPDGLVFSTSLGISGQLMNGYPDYSVVFPKAGPDGILYTTNSVATINWEYYGDAVKACNLLEFDGKKIGDKTGIDLMQEDVAKMEHNKGKTQDELAEEQTKYPAIYYKPSKGFKIVIMPLRKS